MRSNSQYQYDCSMVIMIKTKQVFQAQMKTKVILVFLPPDAGFEPVSWQSLMHEIVTSVLISFVCEANCNAHYLPMDVICESACSSGCQHPKECLCK